MNDVNLETYMLILKITNTDNTPAMVVIEGHVLHDDGTVTSLDSTSHIANRVVQKQIISHSLTTDDFQYNKSFVFVMTTTTIEDKVYAVSTINYELELDDRQISDDEFSEVRQRMYVVSMEIMTKTMVRAYTKLKSSLEDVISKSFISD